MVQIPGDAGAVKSPVGSIVPQEDDHAMSPGAENCWVVPTGVTAAKGVIVIGDEIRTFVEAVDPVPSVEVAVTLQACCVSGAVKLPELSMVPHVDDQVTATLAVNAWVEPSLTVGDCGAMASCGSTLMYCVFLITTPLASFACTVMFRWLPAGTVMVASR